MQPQWQDAVVEAFHIGTSLSPATPRKSTDVGFEGGNIARCKEDKHTTARTHACLGRNNTHDVSKPNTSDVRCNIAPTTSTSETVLRFAVPWLIFRHRELMMFSGIKISNTQSSNPGRTKST